MRAGEDPHGQECYQSPLDPAANCDQPREPSGHHGSRGSAGRLQHPASRSLCPLPKWPLWSGGQDEEQAAPLFLEPWVSSKKQHSLSLSTAGDRVTDPWSSSGWVPLVAPWPNEMGEQGTDPQCSTHSTSTAQPISIPSTGDSGGGMTAAPCGPGEGNTKTASQGSS